MQSVNWRRLKGRTRGKLRRPEITLCQSFSNAASSLAKSIWLLRATLVWASLRSSTSPATWRNSTPHTPGLESRSAHVSQRRTRRRVAWCCGICQVLGHRISRRRHTSKPWAFGISTWCSSSRQIVSPKPSMRSGRNCWSFKYLSFVWGTKSTLPGKQRSRRKMATLWMMRASRSRGRARGFDGEFGNGSGGTLRPSVQSPDRGAQLDIHPQWGAGNERRSRQGCAGCTVESDAGNTDSDRLLCEGRSGSRPHTAESDAPGTWTGLQEKSGRKQRHRISPGDSERLREARVGEHSGWVRSGSRFWRVHWESRGDAGSFAAVTAAERDEQSEFESQPEESKATAMWSPEAISDRAEMLNFESNPAKSSAEVTWETQVAETTHGRCVFENQPLHTPRRVRRRVFMTRSTRLMTQRMRTEVAHHTVDDLVPQKLEEEATSDFQPDVPQVCVSLPDEAGVTAEVAHTNDSG